MNIYFFSDITDQMSFLGGKGLNLGLMKNAGFPVPDGLILISPVITGDEWNEIFSWWKKNNCPELAIRSSATDEDSGENSFAGQNSTYLNIKTESAIKKAVANCFQSCQRNSSVLYREHFSKSKTAEAGMNVVIQAMVDPKFSGVYFSTDPRGSDSGWMVEAIEGLGEALVSGKKTPWHFEENKISETSLFDLKSLIETAEKVKKFFNVDVDVEWSIDQNNELKILQARPITALSGKSEEKRFITSELKRLHDLYPSDTIWDGSTFAEWSGPPSELTFSIWKEAFSKDNSFSKALKKIGYVGIVDELSNSGHSLLERIFNRGYLNISLLAPLYFGPIPYRLSLDKEVTVKFDTRKMTVKNFILTPFTLFRMLKVGIDLSSRRHSWISECERELHLYVDKTFRVKDSAYYKNFSTEKLFSFFENEVKDFYSDTLVWPLLLITLIDSTTKTIKELLKNVPIEGTVETVMNGWLAAGLHTVTMDMNGDYQRASEDFTLRQHFLHKYGHRGPGELELTHPRWIEMGDLCFHKTTSAHPEGKLKTPEVSVEMQIAKLMTYKKDIILKEWKLLVQMLELRERWKMHLLQPYLHIRLLALEIGKKYNVGEDIFWFSFEEILSKQLDLRIAKERKKSCELSKSIYLPSFVQLSKIEDIINNKITDSDISLSGIPLSPGLVFGEVRIVTDPESVDTSAWPLNTILVAEATDPGWTGLFLKSRAVVVEKGGVLSHCAIVAREMSLPAISGIKQCHLRLKDGDKIWVDGNNGRITLS